MSLFKVVVLAGVVGLQAWSCGPSTADIPPWTPIPEPPPEEVESVIFLVGDAGEARLRDTPLLHRMREEVELWSERLGRDSAVVVLYLGDIVYPAGLHPPGSPEFPEDSAVVEGQLRIVGGPKAREHRTLGLFMAGNHDWGEEPGWEGTERLENLEQFLARARERGYESVELLPEAGAGGPAVLDIGDHVRLVLVETAWWLLQPDRPYRAEVIAGVEEAIRTRGERNIMMAGHHPWKTGGAHGGLVDFWKTLGVEWLLWRTGSLLQDLNSPPYRDLVRRLEEVFRRVGNPLIYAGGHDHSLQLLRGVREAAPEYTIVSGSGSKLTGVTAIPGSMYMEPKPGYVRVTVSRDGSVALFVEAAPAEFLSCGDGLVVNMDDGMEVDLDAEREKCMAEGVAAFETVYSARLYRRGEAAP